MATREKQILEASINILIEIKKEIERKEKVKAVKRLIPKLPKPYITFKTSPTDTEVIILRDLYWQDDRNDLLQLNQWHISDFERLFELVSLHTPNVVTNARQLTPRLKLAITLRYMATGESLKILEDLTKISKSAICLFIPKVLKNIYEALLPYSQIPSTKEEWQENSNDFENLWHFKHCLGVVAGKRIRLKSSNQKPYGFVLFTTIDAHCRFTSIDIDSRSFDEQNEDNLVFENGNLYTKLLTEELNIPDDAPLFDDDKELLPYFFIGDVTFGFDQYILRPFENYYDLNVTEKIFNFRLRYACMVEEYTFRKFIKRFGILKRPLDIGITTAKLALKTYCALHNYLTQKRQTPGTCSDTLEDDLPETFSPVKTENENLTYSGDWIRERLSHFFTTEGNVDFQWEQLEEYNQTMETAINYEDEMEKIEYLFEDI